MNHSCTLRWLLAGTLTICASHVAARDFDCIGGFGDEDVRGNLNVAAPCRLEGTEVHGDVTIFAGGSLTARDVRIRGDLEGERADFADVAGSRIDGNVQLEEFVGDPGSIFPVIVAIGAQRLQALALKCEGNNGGSPSAHFGGTMRHILIRSIVVVLLVTSTRMALAAESGNPAYNWSGFYTGVNVGWNWVRTSNSGTAVTSAAVAPASCARPPY